MREIKFRAWDTKNKEFVYLTLIPGVHFIEAMVKSGGCLEPWEQFVGILDKNGKEIYEGDILEFNKFEWYRSPIKTKEEIDKLDSHYFEMKWERDGWLYDGSFDDLSTYCEVMGNIHENPELLK